MWTTSLKRCIEFSNGWIDVVDTDVAIIMIPKQFTAEVLAAEEYIERNTSVSCLERKESVCFERLMLLQR